MNHLRMGQPEGLSLNRRRWPTHRRGFGFAEPWMREETPQPGGGGSGVQGEDTMNGAMGASRTFVLRRDRSLPSYSCSLACRDRRGF
ncbi:hypothetical protein BHE74_00015374 [Ensete ventricosum]|nr:hypothetical protein BHE74_00015374 [Ensete ventricosum]